MEWTVGIDEDGNVVFVPGVSIPGRGVVNLVIKPEEAIEIGRSLVKVAASAAHIFCADCKNTYHVGPCYWNPITASVERPDEN